MVRHGLYVIRKLCLKIILIHYLLPQQPLNAMILRIFMRGINICTISDNTFRINMKPQFDEEVQTIVNDFTNGYRFITGRQELLALNIARRHHLFARQVHIVKVWFFLFYLFRNDPSIIMHFTEIIRIISICLYCQFQSLATVYMPIKLYTNTKVYLSINVNNISGKSALAEVGFTLIIVFFNNIDGALWS